MGTVSSYSFAFSFHVLKNNVYCFSLFHGLQGKSWVELLPRDRKMRVWAVQGSAGDA